ncbi:transposase [Streptomyces sp. HD]|nr:transposase [Streptomyces sp. HD]MDC0772873.1 transposase [Streptomyces sp. HD]
MQACWKKIWSTNPLERLNRENKRWADVVQVFDHRYLSEGSMAELLDPMPGRG